MNSPPQTIKKILNIATQYLKRKKIDNPRLTAEILLSFILGLERIDLYLNYSMPLNKKEIKDYWAVIKRRAKGEPIQYITGKKEFWSLEFDVNIGVFIPRPETEILVEYALEIAKKIKNPIILDLGTGCGAIAIAIAKEIRNAKIWATDISDEAIRIAIFNAKKHNVLQKIRFLQGDLWEPLRNIKTKFHLIVTNPPYVAKEDYGNLPVEVREWEPKIALNGGPGGISIIKRIIKEAHRFLYPEGWIIMEVSPEQTITAMDLLKDTGKFKNIKRIKDYSHRFRIVKACKI